MDSRHITSRSTLTLYCHVPCKAPQVAYTALYDFDKRGIGVKKDVRFVYKMTKEKTFRGNDNADK